MPNGKLTAAAKLEDGSYITFDLSMPVNSLCRKIGARAVETIVFGEMDANDNCRNCGGRILQKTGNYATGERGRHNRKPVGQQTITHRTIEQKEKLK